MQGTAIVILIFALLGLLGWGGLVVFTVAAKGWFDNLVGPTMAAGIFAIYFVIALVSRKRSRAFAGVLGMLLTVPLVCIVASMDRWEPRSFILGGVPALLLFVPSLVLVVKSRKPAPPDHA
jgi:hypothetical protein